MGTALKCLTQQGVLHCSTFWDMHTRSGCLCQHIPHGLISVDVHSAARCSTTQSCTSSMSPANMPTDAIAQMSKPAPAHHTMAMAENHYIHVCKQVGLSPRAHPAVDVKPGGKSSFRLMVKSRLEVLHLPSPNSTAPDLS